MPIFTSFDDAWRWFIDGGELEPIGDHWQRFTAGRAQFLAFQAPLGELPVAHEIEALQDELADVDGLDLMPREALHLSIRGVGFQVIARSRPDDVTPDEVPRIGRRAAAVIATTAPVDATFGPVNVFPDALVLQAHDGGRLGQLRARLDAIERPDALALDPAHYLPHVTIAWFRDVSCAGELRRRLPPLRDRVLAPTRIRRLELARWWFTGDDPAATPEREVLRSYLLGR